MIIEYNDEKIEMSEKFSFNKGNAIDIPDGINVYACSFSKEIPDTEVFRKDMKGVTFYNCNLDNCIVPEGNKVIGGSQRRYEVQNDGNDWLIDEEGNPIKPIDFKIFEKLDLPIPDPKDIPDEPVEEPIDLKKVAEELINK